MTRDTLDIAFNDLKFKDKTFEQFIDVIRRWYAGIPYSITDKNQNGRNSECHPSLLEDGRVVADEGKANEQLYQSLLYAAFMAVGADISAEEQTSDGRMVILRKWLMRLCRLQMNQNKQSRAQGDRLGVITICQPKQKKSSIFLCRSKKNAYLCSVDFNFYYYGEYSKQKESERYGNRQVFKSEGRSDLQTRVRRA